MSADVRLGRRVMAARRLVTHLQKAHQDIDELVVSFAETGAAGGAALSRSMRRSIEDVLASARDFAADCEAAERRSLPTTPGGAVTSDGVGANPHLSSPSPRQDPESTADRLREEARHDLADEAGDWAEAHS